MHEPHCLLHERHAQRHLRTKVHLVLHERRDEAGGDDKIIAVPVGDQRQVRRQELTDVSEFHRLEIQHFFEVYKDLEPGKSVEGAHWAGREEAETCVEEARKRAQEHGVSTARWPMPKH